jgi:alkanesulfonate monooxygenase SsuD/methylene tetrahydromethanopterin reductase-like flavin-dependent oxidoreductase (luciferase family)
MVFVGGPNEVADRILHLHSLLGHSRQIVQLDVGGLPQRDVLRGIELLGTESSRRSAPSSLARESPRFALP